MKNLLKFKDMYLINSHRYKDGFVQDGKYTESELNDMITNQGYIPVANIEDLDNFRIITTQEMGVGSPWVGNYTTGYDKKYVQIYHIYYGGGELQGNTGDFNGIYDGNLTTITNFSLTIPWLGDIYGIARNILITSVTSKIGILFEFIYNGGIVEDCDVTAEINTTVVGGTVLGLVVADGGILRRSIARGYVVSTTGTVGGAITRVDAGGVVEDCKAYTDVTGALNYIGGFTSRDNGGVIRRCSAHGKVTNSWLSGNAYTGGFIGYSISALIDCYATGEIDAPNSGSVGGFCGRATATSTQTNCYSIGLVTATGLPTRIGGFCGRSDGAVFTSCYYDSDTSGMSDTGKGEPKTTTVMQQGTIPDTAIYVGWSDTIWDEVDNTHYPVLL